MSKIIPWNAIILIPYSLYQNPLYEISSNLSFHDRNNKHKARLINGVYYCPKPEFVYIVTMQTAGSEQLNGTTNLMNGLLLGTYCTSAYDM